MDELMAFVRARLAEDERLAQRAEPVFDAHSWELDEVQHDYYDELAPHISRNSPTRVLHDVQARRKTLARCHEEMLSGIPRLVWFAQMTAWEMAQRWDDHDDFNEGWRP